MAKNEVLTKTEHIQNRIQDAHTSSRNNQAELDDLRKERARLVLSNSNSKKTMDAVRDIDREIKGLAKSIDNAPAEINLLQENLKTEQVVTAQAERDILLAEQKEIAEQVVELSEALVDDLKLAMKSNSKLDIVYRRYNELLRQTNENVLDSCHCEPSRGMLKYIYETLSAELVGGVHNRIQLPVPSPQI